jgi:hypothetical protein
MGETLQTLNKMKEYISNTVRGDNPLFGEYYNIRPDSTLPDDWHLIDRITIGENQNPFMYDDPIAQMIGVAELKIFINTIIGYEAFYFKNINEEKGSVIILILNKDNEICSWEYYHDSFAVNMLKKQNITKQPGNNDVKNNSI